MEAASRAMEEATRKMEQATRASMEDGPPRKRLITENDRILPSSMHSAHFKITSRSKLDLSPFKITSLSKSDLPPLHSFIENLSTTVLYVSI